MPRNVWASLVAVTALSIAVACTSGTSPAGVATKSVSKTLASTTPSPSSHASTPPVSPTSSPIASGCRSGNPLANVYHMYRFKIFDNCMTIKGIVRRVINEADGDLHIDVQLNAELKDLLNGKNMSAQHGDMVAEIVPADRAGCPSAFPMAVAGYDYGHCTGANMVAPHVGAYVSMAGPFVLDQAHGWNEIHPVWKWVQLG